MNINEIIRKAFKAGENWGVTYSTWFTPTAKETEERIQEIIEELTEGLSETEDKFTTDFVANLTELAGPENKITITPFPDEEHTVGTKLHCRGWSIIKTPCFPSCWKIRELMHAEDNSTWRYHRTIEEAKATIDRLMDFRETSIQGN
jgi:hypothetical protein